MLHELASGGLALVSPTLAPIAAISPEEASELSTSFTRAAKWSKLPKAVHKWSDRAAFAACALKIYGLRFAAIKIELATERERAKAARPKPLQGAQPMQPSAPLDAGAKADAGAGAAGATPAPTPPQPQPLKPSRMPRPGPNDVTLADIAAAAPRYDPRLIAPGQ